MTTMMDGHDWKHDYSESRGERFVRHYMCRTCGSTRSSVSERNGLIFQDIPEPCDIAFVRNVMDE